MKVLAVNSGSSTLKFKVIKIDGSESGATLVSGLIEIGSGEGGRFISGGHETALTSAAADQGAAIGQALELLSGAGLSAHGDIDAVGHRVVHGGPSLVEPALIHDGVLAGIEDAARLAPLHNEPALAAIRAVRTELGNNVPMVAVFDTAFHSKIPPHAALYALPRDLAHRLAVRRYGFHGLAHRCMAERYPQIAPGDRPSSRLITLQLGNGCSAAAVLDGRSVDTSMGFTPLEGLVMGTRSGDIDPSLPGYLARQEGVDIATVEGWLNKQSGLLGVSARSSDMRALLEAAGQGDRDAGLAIDMFCYRIRKQIGAYMASLGGADAVLLGGGIVENSPDVRARIFQGMEWCGLLLDPERNNRIVDEEGVVTAEDAGTVACVISVDEELVIARDTAAAVGAVPRSS